MEEILLHVEDFSMAYRDTPVLFDLDLDLPGNIRCAIVGPNGAGKSTLIKGILGLHRALSGEVLLWGKNVEEVRRRIAYVPQRSSVHWDFPTTVLDVVMMGRYAEIGLFRWARKKDKERAWEALEEMQMTDLANRQISELSGGQKQRVFIARALAQEAELYLMDEPLAGVDERTERIIIEKFEALQKDGKTVIAVHHDLSTLPLYFDYLVALNRTIQAAGRMEELDLEASIARAFRREAV